MGGGGVFKENLKKARSTAGFSQKELATKLFISQQAYAKYEMGTASPNPEMLAKIAAELDISVDDLLSESGYSGSNFLAQAAQGNLRRKGVLDYINVESREEAALVFAYRKATSEDKRIFDILAEKYIPIRERKSVNVPVSYAPPEPAISIGDEVAFYLNQKKLQDSLGREPTLSEIVAATGLSEDKIKVLAEHDPPSDAAFQYYYQLEKADTSTDKTMSPAQEEQGADE